MKAQEQKVLNETALTFLEDLATRIETCVVRVTDIKTGKGTFVYGSAEAPQYACDGTGSLTVKYINDGAHEEAMLLRTDQGEYVPEPGAYDADLPDTDAEPKGHVEELKAIELAKVSKSLRDHASMLEDGTLTLDGFSLVKPAKLVEGTSSDRTGFARAFTGTGNLALAFHDASARAAHLAHAEVAVD